MGCSFCLPRRCEETAPVETAESRRTPATGTKSDSLARKARNTDGVLATTRGSTEDRHASIITDHVAKSGLPSTLESDEEVTPKPQSDSETLKAIVVPHEQQAANRRVHLIPTQTKHIAMTKHTDVYGAPPPFCFKCAPPDYRYTRCAAGGYVAHPEPVEKLPHRHHEGKSRRQNDAAEKYRPRSHHRGYQKRRSADDTLYEVSGLRMPETDFSDNVPWRLTAACYQSRSREVAIQPQ